jgi:transcriptional regulator with XRE-family HTH domain
MKPTPSVKTRPLIAGFGRRVRSFRLAAGISQGELGRLAGVQYKFISLVELGRSNPSLATMFRIAAALECELVDLLPREHEAAGVALRSADAMRAREAVNVLHRIFAPRQRSAKAI